GVNNDGVFSNLMAKPTIEPEENDDIPPSYEEAAADQAPPYWESTVLSPYGDEVFVDGLPVGNFINFLWNLMVSSAFQFLGFLLTYLLHTSHAAKQGSRAGLGITFISYGYYLIPDYYRDNFSDSKFEPNNPNNFDVTSDNTLNGNINNYHSNLDDTFSQGTDDTNSSNADDIDGADSTIFAYGVIAVGLFIIFKSLIDYHRARQMERVILQAPSNVV
ncbi:Bsd2p ASCRUDRAFT_29104, partial [Ascoidea rubescens DSM 1968]